MRWWPVVVLTIYFTSAHSISAQTLDRGELVKRYCLGCHSARLKTGGMVLEGLDATHVANDAGTWERVLRMVRIGQMPPAGMPRPDAPTAAAFVKNLEEALDKATLEDPNPGSTMPHRLNRAEYSNAVRDLLAVDTNPGDLLPVDESGNGFDNMADLLSMSTSLLERYLSAARHVSKLAVGDLGMKSEELVFGTIGKADRADPNPQEVPFDARGGIALRHYFPIDADYEFRIALAGAAENADTPYKVLVPLKAGMHSIVATFLKESAMPEVAAPANGRRAAPARGGSGPPPVAQMDLRIDGARVKLTQVPETAGPPEIGTLTVAGPFHPTGRGDTPSRAKIFVCRPTSPQQEEPCAQKIFANLAYHAFRRPVADADIKPLLGFYKDARTEGGDFDAGIQNGLQALLVSPAFLYRVERTPKGAAAGSVYRLDDYDLASRLSFCLWSSIPDDELLDLAGKGKLSDPAVLKAQLHRMLADPRSDALIENFGSQWLYLRTLANARPDAEIFAEFDENLRQAFLTETKLFLNYVFREDRPILELLDANYTFLNERLAEHYGIPGVYGSHFRKVTLTDSTRGGLLGQGSILTVTSYPNRTSVVLRGKWVLENLLGTPPPPPPPNVPELKPKAADGRQRSLREAMEEHRANAICRSCHGRMDPIGFALENFNGIGEYRAEDAGAPIDASGKLPDGSEFTGPAGLRKLLATGHRDEFIETVASKLLMYALGRGLEPYDKPTVRTIARAAARDNYRLSAFIEAVVDSVPFQMRRAPD